MPYYVVNRYYKINSARYLVCVVVIATMRANESGFLSGRIFREKLCRILIMTAGTLNGVVIRKAGAQPIQNDLRQNAFSPTERTGRIEPPQNRIPDEGRFVGEAVEHLSQVLVNAERNDGLFG